MYHISEPLKTFDLGNIWFIKRAQNIEAHDLAKKAYGIKKKQGIA